MGCTAPGWGALGGLWGPLLLPRSLALPGASEAKREKHDGHG